MISRIRMDLNLSDPWLFMRGKPKRNDYRKFKIKGIEGADDYGSMREVLTRRFTHGLKEQKESKEIGGFSSFPDPILMDGGKGQVNVALQVLDDLRLNIRCVVWSRMTITGQEDFIMKIRRSPLIKTQRRFG